MEYPAATRASLTVSSSFNPPNPHVPRRTGSQRPGQVVGIARFQKGTGLLLGDDFLGMSAPAFRAGDGIAGVLGVGDLWGAANLAAGTLPLLGQFSTFGCNDLRDVF